MPYIRETAEHYLYSNLSGGFSFGAFIAPKERDDLSYENLQSFFGCKIGYEDKGGREERYAEVLKNTYQVDSLFPYESLDKLRKALETGEIDVMVTSATNMDISKEKILHKFCPDQLYFMVNQKNEYMMNELDDALASLTVDEPTYLYQLQKKYLPMYETNELDKEEENYLKAFGTIRVGVPADRYPISKYDSRSGTCKGMIEDYLEVLAEKINVTFETVPITKWGDEKVDLYLPVTKEEINYHKEIKEVSESFMESALYAFVREGEELQASKQWDIGIPMGILDKKGLIVKRYPNVNLITYQDVKSCLKDVKSGKLDGMVHNVNVLNYQQRNSGHHRLQVSSMIHIPVDYSFGGTREKSRLIRILNKGIRQIDNGDVDQILATYVGDPEGRVFWKNQRGK